MGGHGGSGSSMGGHGGSGGSFSSRSSGNVGYGGSGSSFSGSGGGGGSFGGGGSSSRRPSYTTCTQQNSLTNTNGVNVNLVQSTFWDLQITIKIIEVIS